LYPRAGSGETLRRALWVCASQVEERLSVSSAELRAFTQLPSREILDSVVSRERVDVTLGSFEHQLCSHNYTN